MRIGGYQPLSLCDYPGTPAAVLFTQGCNWRCPYCHNPSLLPLEAGESPYPDKDILERLKQRDKLLQGVVITGGEPTLQPELLPFIESLKKMGFKVKLDTNGSRPGVVAALLARDLIDYCAMDIKAPWEKYDLLTGRARADVAAVQESVKIISRDGVDHHFRTTYARHYLAEKDLATIRQALPQGSAYLIQKCNQD
ncbi:anaerobic ribonucleoside-triphosphate reductase activating protein [Desulfogranum mediterraneum]|uniref:anaerobic ribonucleoside-triphosphate reductase activating protein n=1 Tax=Desulfogranum mediterraneum TaxID=160661 RepID=UPI0003F766D7|nr:anaerobic ribonucleoside-triphosphate reductase activating protein [Desulfogranum mediterraneum]